ncbi:glycosyltransferase family 2 protein [Lacticaseibacillus paracasei]|uniref:glycosyltransferase family 2 protein n=1 Tax=Lacticaseibacillus paracasei TaxID=1597 RepID=UPI003DA67726
MRFKLSIIIPIYNSADFLSGILEDLEQASKESLFEVIIVDDGSSVDQKEKEQEILSDREIPNLRVFWNRHGFQAQARTFGLTRVNGEFVLFLDSDDRLPPLAIQKYISNLDGHDLIIGSVNKQIGQHTFMEKPHNFFYNDKQRSVADFLTKNNETDVGLWNKVFSVNFLKKNAVIFWGENFFEDTMFILETLVSINPDRVLFLSEITYTLIKRSSSTTGTYDTDLPRKVSGFERAVETYLQSKEIELSEKARSAWRLRLQFFILNRKIFSGNSDFVAEISIFRRYGLLKILNNKHLKMKYRLSMIFAMISPGLYSKLYAKH